jgi:RNA polymerase sigma-70 factor (ECF subfamily)
MVEPNEVRLEELQLRDRILAGDRAAAERFFEHHLDSLFEFVHYRVGRDRGLAEDLVQDTLLVAVERLESFDGRSSLHTWLCGIAKNKIRARRRRLRPVAIEDVLEAVDPEIESILTAIDTQPLPEWVIERRETEELVGATLSSLPPEYRRFLVEKYVEGRTVGELAAATGRGEKAAESLLHRARLAFARVFQLLAGAREAPEADDRGGAG